MSYKPSTFETIDLSLWNWLNDKMNVSCTTNKGWEKVPCVWTAPERAYQTKNTTSDDRKNRDMRDADGALIFPIITLTRNGFSKDPTKKGMFWAALPPVNDKKNGTITIARRIKQDKTANFANSDSYRLGSQIAGTKQINFPKPKNQKIVYETITIPIPVYVDVNYTINVRTEYQQQMNEIVQPFVTGIGGINYLVLKQDGHQYESFFQADFNSDNNLVDIGDETRIYETTIDIKVLGYLVGGGKNENHPEIITRENSVEIKMPREHVILGDVPDWPDGKYRS